MSKRAITAETVAAAVRGFAIRGQYLGCRPHVAGHINDTFIATFSREGAQERFIVQHINKDIFKNPPAMMENIVRVTNESRARLSEAGVTDTSRRSLTVVPATDGRAFHLDEGGDYWRA